jgi:hypothetical protein
MFHVTKRGLAAGLVIAAASFPAAAEARLNLNPPAPTSASPSSIVNGRVPALPRAAASVHQPAAAVQSGFQWDDAGIGAAGAAVLLGAGVAASGAARRRRPLAG